MCMSKIQIQHLLKLNKWGAYKRYTLCSIQIQHLLKLNENGFCVVISFKKNSNTTLVKVKLKKVPSP